MATPIIVKPTKPSAIVVDGTSSRTPVKIGSSINMAYLQSVQEKCNQQIDQLLSIQLQTIIGDGD